MYLNDRKIEKANDHRLEKKLLGGVVINFLGFFENWENRDFQKSYMVKFNL